MNPTAVSADGLLYSGVSGNGHALPLSQSTIGLGVQAWFVLAAAVLFLAVAGKLQWIWKNPLWEDIAIGGVWITLAAIVLEGWAAASILLLSRRNAAYIGLAIYAVLLIASIGFWISGQNCQCFGDWQLGAFKVPTWLLPIYNLIAVIFFAIIASKPNQSTTIKSRLRLPDFGTQFGLVLGVLFGLFMLSTAQGQPFLRSGSASNEVVLQGRRSPGVGSGPTL